GSELPERRKRLEGNVESTVGDGAGPDTLLHHLQRFGADGDEAAWSGIQARNLAVRSPRAHQLLQPLDFAECRVESRTNGPLVQPRPGVRDEGDVGAHGRAA